MITGDNADHRINLGENPSDAPENGLPKKLLAAFLKGARVVLKEPRIKAFKESSYGSFCHELAEGFSEWKTASQVNENPAEDEQKYGVFVSGKIASLTDINLRESREMETETARAMLRNMLGGFKEVITERPRAICMKMWDCFEWIRNVSAEAELDKLMAAKIQMNVGHILNEAQVEVFNMISLTENEVMERAMKWKIASSLEDENENEKLIAFAIISGETEDKFKPHWEGGVNKVITSLTKFMCPVPPVMIVYGIGTDAKQSFRDAGRNWILYAVLAVEDAALLSMIVGWYLKHRNPRLSTFLQVCGQLLAVGGVFLSQAPVFG